MSCRKKSRKTSQLNLESDLSVSPEDVLALKQYSSTEPLSLEDYIAFLYDIGAFSVRKTEAKIFSEVFEF